MCKFFYYKKYDFNKQTGVLSLHYATDNHSFTEKITFPGAPFELNEAQEKALDDILFLTHVAFGISYYKAFLSDKIQIESGILTKSEAEFFNTFYLNGLGEFACRNNVDLSFNFPHGNVQRDCHTVQLRHRAFVPVGGGKDSCVSMELLKKCEEEIIAFSVGNPRPIRECVEKSGLGHLVLTRKIAPELLELNASGTVYNGHVPITGLIAFLLWICAILYNYKYAILSCERSANSPNLIHNGLKVNHQYSKSLDFEHAFHDLTCSVTPDFLYFSLLRPLSEAHIAKLFTTHCQAYFDVFTSCNKAFKLDETKRLDRWCGNCDKCRFVFLILAPFMDKETLVHIVGTNPLNDKAQLQGYEELLAISGHKPFECVGEVEECRWAFSKLCQDSQWENDFVIKELKEKISQDEGDIFKTSSLHLIPKELKNVMEYFK